MKKLVLFLVLSVVLVSFGEAQTETVVVQVSTERQDGKWIGWSNVSVTFETGADGQPVAYTPESVPDHNCVSKKDLQVWYIENGAGDYNKLTFSATEAGILQGRKDVQYGLWYSLDGVIWSERNSKVITKPGKGNSP